MPMSKSASAWPLTTAARWNTESVSGGECAVDDGGIGEIAGTTRTTRESPRSGGATTSSSTSSRRRARHAAGVGQRAAREDRAGKAGAEETGAAGDHDAHRWDPSVEERWRYDSGSLRRRMRILALRRRTRRQSMPRRLTIATRESALALWQAEHVRARLAALHPAMRGRACSA